MLDAQEIAANLVGNGCPVNRVVAWASISLAESGWDENAVSVTDARGLYQIEPYSWPAGAGPLSEWAQPGPNSRAAVLLSGGGMNFAPWDTAYADIYASGRAAYLAWPQPGSAAANNMAHVSGLLGKGPWGSGVPPSQPGVDKTLPAAVVWYGQASHRAVPGLVHDVDKIGARIRRSYRVRRRLCGSSTRCGTGRRSAGTS